ncbi:chromatin structure-remodeling complex subunit RSC7 [Yamadazyma tenuis]|nr:chromatin structure-remodeling complex subunit RSC7 [Yamadazyma tenuis]
MPTKRSTRSNISSPTASPQSRRRTAARKADLSGLDLDPEPADDDEYSEPGQDEDPDDSILNDEEDVKPAKRKRDISSVKSKDSDDDDDDEEDDEEDDKEEEDDEKEEYARDNDEEENQEGQPKPKVGPKIKIKKPAPKKRGRKRTKLTLAEDGVYYDEEGNLLRVTNDEIVVDDEDPKAIEKIDIDGNLLGGRRFINKTFTVLGQGDRKYMISTEPARLVGFRDSYLLFKTHTRLFKKVCTNEEKMDLIDRNIIPNSYKGRSVNLVTARSIYREFGAKILDNGRKVLDDFWEQQARDNGDVEGEYADPTELYNYNMSKSAGYDATSTNQPSQLSGAALVSYQSDPTWMYQIAMQTRELNARFLEGRSEAFSGFKDTYTGHTFVPSGTQPSKYKISKIGESETLTFDTKFSNSNIRQKFTALSSIPKSVIDTIKDETVKAAILEQIRYENSL